MSVAEGTSTVVAHQEAERGSARSATGAGAVARQRATRARASRSQVATIESQILHRSGMRGPAAAGVRERDLRPARRSSRSGNLDAAFAGVLTQTRRALTTLDRGWVDLGRDLWHRHAPHVRRRRSLIALGFYIGRWYPAHGSLATSGNNGPLGAGASAMPTNRSENVTIRVGLRGRRVDRLARSAMVVVENVPDAGSARQGVFHGRGISRHRSSRSSVSDAALQRA
jgi:hypothetical protein